jgi:cystathionine gamma-synthase
MREQSFEDMARLIKDLRGIDVSARPLEREATRLVRGYRGGDQETGAVNTPIYQSATFAHPGFDQSTGFGYSRYGNPTRLELENTVALLEGGRKAWAFSSGMAAISTMLKLFRPGDHVLIGDDLYGGTYRLVSDIYASFGIKFTYVDATDLARVKAALRPDTKALFIETPTNPLMKVSDLAALSTLMKETGGFFIVDNTFLTPHFQKPFDFGADIIIHSGTKYLGGHNDIMSGFIVVKDEQFIEQLFTLAMSEGGMLAPFDSWLTLRSLKTLAVRLDRQQENAFKIVSFLKAHDKIERVHYVGDPEHPGYEIAQKQTTGSGAMISFEVARSVEVPDILDRLKLILFAESLGGVESLMTFPLVQTHGSMPADVQAELGITDRLLRLSVGLEDADDLVEDLAQALR